MSEPFLAEIRIVSFNFAPQGWAFCEGQLLPINQNQALFSLLGTTFGGDGQTTFALPDLRGRVPIHVGNGHTLGERAGELAHTLTMAEMPHHNHLPRGYSGAASRTAAPNNIWASSSQNPFLTGPVPADTGGAMHPQAITNTGGSQPHTNVQPVLGLNFCIALQGIFPSPN